VLYVEKHLNTLFIKIVYTQVGRKKNGSNKMRMSEINKVYVYFEYVFEIGNF